MDTPMRQESQHRDIGLYVPLEVSAPRHPKIRKLARRLGVSRPTALGHMCTLWAELLSQGPDGHIGDSETVEMLAEWDGDEGAFTASALAVGLLDEVDGEYRAHDYYDRLSHLRQVRQRKLTRDRVRSHRERKKAASEACNAESVTQALQNVSGVTIAPEQEQEHKHKHTLPPQEGGSRGAPGVGRSGSDRHMSELASEANADPPPIAEPNPPLKTAEAALRGASATPLGQRGNGDLLTGAEVESYLAGPDGPRISVSELGQQMRHFAGLYPVSAYELRYAMARAGQGKRPIAYAAGTIRRMRQEGHTPPPPAITETPPPAPRVTEQQRQRTDTERWAEAFARAGYQADPARAERMALTGPPSADDAALLRQGKGDWASYDRMVSMMRSESWSQISETIRGLSMQ